MKPKPGATPTCIVYCRTSTAKQKESETVKAQIDRCSRIIDREGLKLLPYGPKNGWVIDDGISGGVLKGRAFATVIDDLRANRLKLDAIVVFSLSRIAREDKFSDTERQEQSARDWGTIKAVLRSKHVIIIDEEGQNDPNTVLFDLKTVLAGEQYRLIFNATTAGKSRRLREGKWARGGAPAWGYTLTGDKKQGFSIVPHPVEADRLRKLLRWFCEFGFEGAARKATAAGWQSPRGGAPKRKGRRKDWTPTDWAGSTVFAIVRNAKTYLGKKTVTFLGEEYVLRFPPLIDREMLRDVERAKKEQTLSTRAPFLTTGYVDCQCGGHIHAKNSRGKHVAACANRCGRMPEEVMSTTIWRATVARLVQLCEQQAPAAPSDSGAALRLAKARVTELVENLSLLFRERTAGMPPAVYRKLSGQLNDEHGEAEEALKRLETAQRTAAQTAERTRTLIERVQEVLEDVVKKEPDLERKRSILGDLLAGGRLTIVEWIDRTKERSPAYCPAGAPDATCGIDLAREEHCWRCCEHGHRAATCPRYGRIARIEFPAVAGLPAAVVRTDRMPLVLTGDAVKRGDGVRLRVDRRASRVGGVSDLTVTSAAALAGPIWE